MKHTKCLSRKVARNRQRERHIASMLLFWKSKRAHESDHPLLSFTIYSEKEAPPFPSGESSEIKQSAPYQEPE